MGWLSVGACALIATYVLYKFLIPHTLKASKETSGQQPHAVEQNVKEKEKSDPLPLSLTGITESLEMPKLEVIPAPTNRAENDRSQLLEIEGKPEPSMRVEPKALNTPQISMPPPPPPTVRSSSPPRLKPPTFSTMPAPPRPSNGFVRPPPSAAASLRVPQTKVLSNTSMAPSSLGVPKKQGSRQVTLKPGHSPLDWAALTNDPRNALRGKDAPATLARVSPSQLKIQNGRKGRDAWTVYQGKVYNITQYLPFHPGGEGELMRGAGKDAAKLFMEVHPWVNWDGMLSECLIGIAVGENEAMESSSSAVGGSLDDMD